MNKRDVYRLALVGAVVVVILNTFLAAHAIHRVFYSQEWVSHTQDVIITTEQVVSRVRNAESSARGFALTASPDFEQQYKTASDRVTESIDHLQQLTLDNPVQQRNIVELRSRVAAKMVMLDTIMAERHGHSTGAINAELLSSIVNDTPDRVENVQNTLRNMLAEERRLLDQRTKESENARRQVWITFIVASLLDFILLVAAFEFLIRLSHEREVIAENAAKRSPH